MNNSLFTLQYFLFTGVATLFLFQSCILFIRSKNNKVKHTMAVLELLWGLMYLLVLTQLKSNADSTADALLRDRVLIVGSFCIVITQLFPIQVLLPGWLNWKRILLLNMPNILLTLAYFGGMRLCNETSETILTYEMLGASITHFNVWFRVLIIVVNLIYIFVILKWLYGYEKRYIHWKNENFADQEYVDISWMRSYHYIVIGISIFYLGILFFGGRVPVLCHCSFVLVSFSYLFYKCLFYESPYPEDFFASKGSMTSVETPTEEETPYIHREAVHLNDEVFENKIRQYTERLKQWMEEEKPYLYYDFKLTDVTRELPLNRSYLSRIFNEGFGQNFSEVVRAYRIEYAKEILKKQPDLPMYKIAELAGFRSDTTFVRAFKQVTNQTPGQYKFSEEFKERS